MMRKILWVLGTVLFTLYAEFLFFVPNVIDLNMLKFGLQDIVREQTGIEIDYDNAKILTTPLLGVGVKADNISVKLPDGTSLFSTQSVKTRLALPSLALLTVKVSCAEVVSPRVNIEIADGKEFKIVRIIEDILNSQESEAKMAAATGEGFNFASLIRIKVPKIKITDYKININDLKSKHYLLLQGDEALISYNVNKFGLKTAAEFFSDEAKNIIANIDINTYIPPAAKLDKEDDPVQRVEIPFVNPVLTYRDYDIKTNVDTKLKIRKNGMYGHLNVDGLTMTLQGMQLPQSAVAAKFRGTTVDTNTNLFVTPEQNIEILGKLDYGKRPNMDMQIRSKEIYLNDVLILARALLDTLRVKHELAAVDASGFVKTDVAIKTNFKKIKALGSIVARDGALKNKNLGIKDFNADINFNDNMIVDVAAYVDGSALKVLGKIDKKSVADIAVVTDNLPLPGLYKAFAPRDLKNAVDLKSANLTLDLKLQGKLKNAKASIDGQLSDLSVTDKKSGTNISNELAKAAFVSDFKTVSGEFDNNNLKISLPGSVISNPKLVVKIDPKNIIVPPSTVNVNDGSKIYVAASFMDYVKKPVISFSADGSFAAADLSRLVGAGAAPFFRGSGVIPASVVLTGTDKRQELTAQIMCSKDNYFTPVDVERLLGQHTLLFARVHLKGDRLNIRDTGIFIVTPPTEKTPVKTTEIAGVSGTISNLNKPVPLINLIKVRIPEDLNMSLAAFKDSAMKLGGQMFVFSNADSPRFRGGFKIADLSIPELFLSMNAADLTFKGKSLDIETQGLDVNGSDMKVNMRLDLNPSPVAVISNLDFESEDLDVDKLMKVADAAAKFAPAPKPNAAPADIPVVIRNGNIDIARLSANPIVLTNTESRIAMRNNVFYLNNLRTGAFGGVVRGNISANLVNTALGIRLRGSGINCEKALLTLAQMKDTLTGTAAFDTDLTLSGITMEEQMRTLAGKVNFDIRDGQLGPFGRLENLILAENIRNSEFFQTTLGGVIDSITSVNTSHYKILDGSLLFKDGVVTLDPITSFGDVLCMHIGGNMNLLTNQADMELRARLASQVSDMLGPIAAVNPVNLIKVTPGLNFLAAKAFTLFTAEVTPEEMAAIPDFKDDYGVMSTTKFQVVLRGDVAKPLSLVKSFKWLALASEIEQAQNFVSTLPSDEEILKMQRKEAIEKKSTQEKVKIFFTPKSKEKI